MFEKFVNASNEVTVNANNAFTISMGTSPFQNGIAFQITGTGYQQAKNVGENVAANAYACPGFITNIASGDGSDPNAPKFCFLFLSSLIRKKVDKDGNVVEPDGEVNKAIIRIITQNAGKPNGTILAAILVEIGNKDIIVSRKFFAAKAKDGRVYTSSIINLNYKK